MKEKATLGPLLSGLALGLCLLISARPPAASGESAATAGPAVPRTAAGEPAVLRAGPFEAHSFTEDYIVQSWNADSGLPDNSVRAIVRTADGFLWLGTSAGLVRFDGVRFTVYDWWNTPHMGDSRVLSLYEDAGHTLWVGTDGGGLCAYRAGEWRSFGKREGLPDSHVRAVVGDRDGVLWAGTEYGLYALDGEAANIYGLDDGLADDLVTALALDGFGRLWAGTMWGGLARFEGVLVQVYGMNDGLGDHRVLSLHAGSDGSVWIGTMEGLFRLPLHERVIHPIPGTDPYPVTAIASGPGGELLVGTMIEGLKILGDDGLNDFSLGEGFGYSHIRAILADRDGYIWVGTDSRGLVRPIEREVGSIASGEGLPEGSVYAIMEDPDGTLWIGTEKSGLFRMQGERAALSLNSSRGLAGDMVRALSRDGFGRLIVGTRDGGLSIVAEGRIENLTMEDGLSSDNITAVLCDQAGEVWIGTDRGLYRSVDRRAENSLPVADFEGLAVRTLYESEKGTLYAGTRRGLWKLVGTSFERIQAAIGDSELDVISIHEDKGVGLWIGTNGGGVACLSEKGINTLTTRDGLPGNFIYSITENDSSRLLMSCEAGVFEIVRDSLIAYAENGSRILAPTLYDDSDGMPSSLCNGYCSPAVCKSALGRLYYPTKMGIAVFVKDGRTKPVRPPVAHVESITAGGTEFAAGADIELRYGTDPVEIRFTAIDYSAPGRCRFLYRLNGHDTAFTALHPHQERTAVFRGLPPGDYEFTVRAIGNWGLWSEGAASAGFVVAAPFYRTTAFAVIIAAGALLSAGVAAALRRHRYIQKQRMKYSTSTISEDRIEKAIDQLTILMNEEKIFLDPDLTLKKLAERLHIHYNHISRIINERYGLSFNNYINRYRVEEAKRRLADPELRNRNILDIMFDVGFYSKSTFNTAFKKFAGSSPSEYRKKHG